MPLGEAIDDPTSNDDYVAKLLAAEAKDRSLKYSSLGLEAYLPRRPTERAPKPNTRFLKNILRDTDNHNAALKRKEEQEARERMRQLRGETSSSAKRHGDRDRGYRDRSPRRLKGDRTSSRRSRHDSSRERDDGRRRRRRHRDRSNSDSDHEGSARSHRRHRDEDRRSRRTREYSESPPRSSRHRRDEGNDHRHRHKRSHRSRSRSPRSSRHLEDERRSHHKPEKPGSGNSREDVIESERVLKECDVDDDSDPLEDLVGPLPATSRKKSPVVSRGRGSYRENTGTIDSHFADDYDPKLDVQLSEDDESSSRPTRRPVAGLMTEEDDWDMALEALRDRAEWKKKGEERLRGAGFDKNVVDKWKSHPAFSLQSSNGQDTEGSVDDFRWAKKGEGREWDRGKVMNEDGIYDVKVKW